MAASHASPASNHGDVSALIDMATGPKLAGL
jgi:hypothetical protein